MLKRNFVALFIAGTWMLLVTMAMSMGAKAPNFVQFLIPMSPAILTLALVAVSQFAMGRKREIIGRVFGWLALLAIPVSLAVWINSAKSADDNHFKNPKIEKRSRKAS